MTELLPCPFCGGKDIRITCHPGMGNGIYHSGEDVFSMCCYNCGATFPNRYRRELLVEAWNRRIPSHSPAPDMREAVPSDVAELVVAARIVAYEDQTPATIKALDRAVEAFSSRVPWDEDPTENQEETEASADASAQEQEPALAAVATFLRFRDESLIPGDADDAERLETAREIVRVYLDAAPSMREAVEALIERLNGENPDKVVATDRLRLFAHDPETFEFDQHDALSLIHIVEETAATLRSITGAVEEQCSYCNGTGDVHRADGEWLGTCTCAAGRSLTGAKP